MNYPLIEEFIKPAQFSLELAKKELSYLAYTHGTLFHQPIDEAWVESLSEHPELAEKIEAFVSRFSRLQDHLGEKLLPTFAKLYGERSNSLIDTLAFAERMEWVESSEDFIALRRLRNQLVHEYLYDASLFLESLLAADQGVKTLQDIVARISELAIELKVISNK